MVHFYTDHDRSEQSDVKVDSLAMAENDSTQPILKSMNGCIN